jgi:hypothetical protein
VAMFIHVVGHNQRFRVVHPCFRRSIETVSRIFHQVLYAIAELRVDMIKCPNTVTHHKIMGSHKWFLILRYCHIYVIHTNAHLYVFDTHVHLLMLISFLMHIPVEMHWCH